MVVKKKNSGKRFIIALLIPFYKVNANYDLHYRQG